jgi:hypothetical protein
MKIPHINSAHGIQKKTRAQEDYAAIQNLYLATERDPAAAQRSRSTTIGPCRWSTSKKVFRTRHAGSIRQLAKS